MDCAGWVGHMFYRADVVDNVIGQVRRQNYLSGIQRRIEQGRSRLETVCMDCWLAMSCPIWFLNEGLQFFPLVSWTERNGVSGPHPGYLVDAIILRSLNGDYLGADSTGRTVTANVNNDLTSGKGTISDPERLNVYFRKVL
jgi:hypothetical protein